MGMYTWHSGQRGNGKNRRYAPIGGVKIDHTNNVVKTMYPEFRTCEEVDVSNLDTSDMIFMRNMFYGFKKLTHLDVSHFKTAGVIDMNGMFAGCYSLNSLDLSRFNTKHVKDASCMFLNCFNLSYLDISSFDTRNMKDMSGMFSGCSKLQFIKLGKHFRFHGGKCHLFVGAVLPTPNGEGFTGKWIRDTAVYGPFTPEELSNNYTAEMAGIWMWEHI